MIVRLLASIAVVGGLAITPLRSEARVLFVPNCDGGWHMMLIPNVPGAPPAPDKRNDCSKACHASAERRTKTGAGKKNSHC